MGIDQKQKEEIGKIIAHFKCPKDFKCYKSGLENLCKAKDGGLEGYVDCLDKDPQNCIFVVPFGGGYFCRCPIRVYIAKKLKK
jgi:hypothetical protein